MAFPLPQLSVDTALGMPLSHRFGVFFFAAGVIPNPLDIRFQRVSGLTIRVETEPLQTGGRNTARKLVPRRLAYENLVMERGFVIGSPLKLQLDAMINEFKFLRADVLITLFSEEAIPIAAWLAMEAFPVRWSTADLNAQEDRVLIDTLELAFTRLLTVQL
ncbi:MAG: phage tail protein [Cyanobium sp.]